MKHYHVKPSMQLPKHIMYYKYLQDAYKARENYLIIIYHRYVQWRDPKKETYFDLLNIKDDTPIKYSLGFPVDCNSPIYLACLHGHEEAFKLLHNSKHYNVHT